MKSILVFGSGAVGIYYGTKLLEAGADVTFLCRSDYQYASKHGFVVHEKNNDKVYHPTIISDLSELNSKSIDLILICTKALNSIDLVAELSKLVNPSTAFCMIQNGLNVEQSLAKAFPDNLLISAVAFCCLQRQGPAYVHCEGFNRLIIGPYPDDCVNQAC